MLDFLYETIPGRFILQILTRPGLSQFCGRFLDSRFSCVFIPYFIRKNRIDLSICEKKHFNSFNDCFCRKVKPQKRPVNPDCDAFVSPCDGLLSIYPIKNNLIVPVKMSKYSTTDLLRDSELANEFDGGYCMVFRLCVNHYHRYCFPDSGSIRRSVKIPGILHTVRPIALRNVPVFVENTREYALLKTDNFGDVVQMEVGAMLVGKIKNHNIFSPFIKGQEKGHFLYGGSTIIVLVKKDTIKVPEVILQRTSDSIETPVKYGQKIGLKIRR